MKMTKRMMAVLSTMMLCMFSGCSGQQVSSKGNEVSKIEVEQETQAVDTNETEQLVHLNIPESWEFETFYPIITPANASSGYGITYYLTSFYDTLVTYNEQGELVGQLAESWSVSEDGKAYTFNLKQGIQFSDGTDFTAEDVVSSLKGVPVNLGQYNGGYGKLSTIIEDVVAIDDYTVELRLIQPYYSALRDLCLANPFGIVSSEQFNEDLTAKESFISATYGTGPYMYEGDGDGQSYNFVKNPNYWGEEPDVDSFSIKVIADNDAKILALKNGELDFISGITKISAESYEQMNNTEGFSATVDDTAMQTYYMGYNLSDPIFGDQVVREAVSCAFDKDEIVSSIYGGMYEGAETFFATTLPYCDVEQITYSFDIEKANQLLEQAGYKDTDGDGIREKDGNKMEADFLYQTGSASDDDMVVYICDQLAKVGIKLTPKSAPMMDWYAMITSGSYGLTIFDTQGGYYDPANVVSNMDPNLSMDPIISQIGSYLPNGSDLIGEVNSTVDEKRIQEIYQTIITTMADNCLTTPIYYTHQVAIFNDKIAEYTFPMDSNFTSIQNIKLK